MDAKTHDYRVATLPEELKRMADDYSETVDAAKEMAPTLAPLRILDILDEMNEAVIDLGNITKVAIEVLDGDKEHAKAVLKGAQELGKKQADRIWQLTGLVLQQMQLTQPEKSTKTSATPSAPGDIQ